MRLIWKRIACLCLLLTLWSAVAVVAHHHSSATDALKCSVCMTAHAAGPKATSNLPKASSVCLSTFRQEPVSAKQLDPNGNVVGPADQRSQIKTFNIAPSWTRLLNANTVFTLGAFVRRDQFNYYPSGNPFADLAPDLQQETLSQDRSNDKLPS